MTLGMISILSRNRHVSTTALASVLLSSLIWTYAVFPYPRADQEATADELYGAHVCAVYPSLLQSPLVRVMAV